MLPATLHDLLTDAECSAAVLISHRPSATSLALGWPRFTEASHRLLSETLRASTPDLFRDATSSAIQIARWGGRTRRLWLDSLPETNAALSKVTDLLGAARDLLARQPYVTADTTRAVAVRAAGVIAGVSFAAATAERERHHEPMGVHAIRLQSAAARVVDSHRAAASTGQVVGITAEPLSPEGALSGPGARFQAAALAWRRMAASSPAPSHQTFALAALTLSQSTAHIWTFVDGTNRLTAVPDKAAFSDSYQAWRHVASLWRGYTAATPGPIEHRPLAAEVVNAARALSDHLGDASSAECGERLVAARQGLQHLQFLAKAHAATTTNLLARGALYVPTERLRSEQVHIVGRARPRLSPCPPRAAGPLLSAIGDGLNSLQHVGQALSSLRTEQQRLVEGDPPVLLARPTTLR